MTDNDEDYNKYMNISDTLMDMFTKEIQNMKIRGENNKANKLKENEVKEIYLSKDKNNILAKKYNVSKTNIRYIKNKQQWKWLTDTFD